MAASRKKPFVYSFSYVHVCAIDVRRPFKGEHTKTKKRALYPPKICPSIPLHGIGIRWSWVVKFISHRLAAGLVALSNLSELSMGRGGSGHRSRVWKNVWVLGFAHCWWGWGELCLRLALRWMIQPNFAAHGQTVCAWKQAVLKNWVCVVTDPAAEFDPWKSS